MKEYNGHRSWNAWNVSLWICNDELDYFRAMRYVKRIKDGTWSVARAVRRYIAAMGGTGSKTPDGAVYNALSVRLCLEDLLLEDIG